MPKPRILVSTNDVPSSALDMLSKHFDLSVSKYSGFEQTEASDNLKFIADNISGVTGIFWSTTKPLTKELITKAGPNLKVVSTASAGYNHIATEELKSRGIKFSNTPGVLDSAVAEIAVGLMISTSRRFTECLEEVRSGEWKIGMQARLGQDLRKSTVGIIGLGGIGQTIVRKLSGFDIGRFVYSGHSDKPEAKELKAERISLDNLLAESDFIVLACPLTSETKHIINEEALKKMKKNAIVINIGRGDLIDQNALYKSLKNNDIYAAGLDVTTPEPLPANHQLLALSNVFILPHIGSATTRTRTDMAELTASNIIAAIKGEPMPSELKL